MGEQEELPPSDATPPPRPVTRQFVVLVAAAVAASTVVAFIAFSLWKDKQPNSSSLSQQVLDSMNQSLANDEDYRNVGLRVRKITVIHAVGNVFEGQATAITRRNVDHLVSVHIFYDGDTLLWHTDPGSFAFTVQDQ